MRACILIDKDKINVGRVLKIQYMGTFVVHLLSIIIY